MANFDIPDYITPYCLYDTMVFSEVQGFALREAMPYGIVRFCANAQSEVNCAIHFRRNFTFHSIDSRTEGVLIVPQDTLN